jgi:hypothetical protein
MPVLVFNLIVEEHRVCAVVELCLQFGGTNGEKMAVMRPSEAGQLPAIVFRL